MSSAAYGGTMAKVLQRLRSGVDAVLAGPDPVARHARLLRRARHSVQNRATATAALIAATTVAIPLNGLGWSDLAWAAATGGVATSTAFALRRSRELERTGPPPPPPPPWSAARPAIERLGAARHALRITLGQLGPLAGDAAHDAAAGERALHELAARIGAVESAMAVAPPQAAEGLLHARALLLDQLHSGVGRYELLVAAAAECVAAGGSTADSFAVRRLEEASDALAGLAAGLRDVRAAER